MSKKRREHEESNQHRLQHAVLRPYRALRHQIGRLVFERRQVVDTAQHVSLEALGVNHPDRRRYEPSPWTMLGSVLPRKQVGETDVFLDLGSGMGRMLQQAATYPFARVIGVEVSEELNRIARMNFEQNKGRFTCEEVEFVTCDAAEFQISDDITHVYLNNSFAGETFTRVIENLIASLDRVPRRMVFMYCHPRLSEEIDATGRFELVSSKRGVEIYESVAGSR